MSANSDLHGITIRAGGQGRRAGTNRTERGESRSSKRQAEALAVTGDYLLEGVTDEAAKARFEDRELLEQFQEVQKLPDEDKALVKSFLGAFLFKRKVQGLSAR